MKKSLLDPLEVPKACQRQALGIIRELNKTPRTGFLDRGVKNCETVGEHTEAAIELAKELFDNMLGLTQILKIHDWPEFLAGDWRTDHLAPPESWISKERKKLLETTAMEMMCTELGPYGDEIFALWLEYEAGETRRAQVAKQLDHAQAILKAHYYEQLGEPVTGQEFFDYYKKSITEPEITKKLIEAGYVF